MRLLLVEDDSMVGESVRQGLRQDGFTVDWVRDGRAAAFARLKGGTGRATRLVEQLLAVARSDPEAADRPMTVADLSAVARDTVAELAPLAAAKGLDLGFSGEAAVTAVGDPEGRRVMLGNLVDNAIRYTSARSTVDVAVAGGDGSSSMTVADDGPGIPPADRERVFGRSYRLAAAESTGSGLGLAIVRQIAQRHGAAVVLGDGLHGRGLTVTVHIPARIGATTPR